jgi:hypothetical protein
MHAAQAPASPSAEQPRAVPIGRFVPTAPQPQPAEIDPSTLGLAGYMALRAN